MYSRPINLVQTTQFKHRDYKRPNSETAETKTIRARGMEIQKIRRETAYIEKTGKMPPKTPNFYSKMLNII